MNEDHLVFTSKEVGTMLHYDFNYIRVVAIKLGILRKVFGQFRFNRDDIRLIKEHLDSNK